MMDCATGIRNGQGHEQSHRASRPNGKRLAEHQHHRAITDPSADDRGGQRRHIRQMPLHHQRRGPRAQPCARAGRDGRKQHRRQRTHKRGLDGEQGLAFARPGEDRHIDPGAQRRAQRHARHAQMQAPDEEHFQRDIGRRWR